DPHGRLEPSPHRRLHGMVAARLLERHRHRPLLRPRPTATLPRLPDRQDRRHHGPPTPANAIRPPPRLGGRIVGAMGRPLQDRPQVPRLDVLPRGLVVGVRPGHPPARGALRHIGVAGQDTRIEDRRLRGASTWRRGNRLRHGRQVGASLMWVWVEPFLGWVIGAVGVMLGTAGAVYGKRMAVWLGKVIGAGIVDTLRTHWSEDMSSKLSPIYAELQIGDGTEKWPNGSDTLPETMQTIYDRQAETYHM